MLVHIFFWTVDFWFCSTEKFFAVVGAWYFKCNPSFERGGLTVGPLQLKKEHLQSREPRGVKGIFIFPGSLHNCPK